MSEQPSPIRPLLGNVELAKPSHRVGENPVTRTLLAWYTLGVQVVLVCVVALSLVLFVDKVYVSSESGRFQGPTKQPVLLASDITTAVSAALLVVRVVTGSWSAITAWRCVYILLEKDSLSLTQVNSMVSYRVLRTVSSTYSWIVFVVLLLLLPAQFAAPLASGAVGWRSVEVLLGNHSVISTAADYPEGTVDNWWWGTYFNNLPTRSNMVTLALRKSFEIFTDKEDPKRIGCRRLVESDLSVGSTVSDTPIPCMVIHSIQWDTTPPPREITDLLSYPSNSVLHDPEAFGVNQANGSTLANNSTQDNPILGDNVGNIAILGLPVWSKKGKSGLPNNPKVFSGSWKIACSYGHSTDKPCNAGPVHVDSMNTTRRLAPYLLQTKLQGNCYFFGTINFTAGVTRSKSTFITRNVLEVDYDSNLQIEANALTEESIYLMNDLFVPMNIASQFITPWGLTDPFTVVVERFFRRSYISIWHGLQNELRYGWEVADSDGKPVLTLGSPPNHVSEAKMNVVRLQATVSRPRVIAWLIANLLMTLSGIILAVIQNQCSRPVVIDHAAAAITANFQDLFEKDTGGLSKLSYLTKEDDKLGKLVLTTHQRGSGLQFAIIPKQAA